MLDIKIIHSKTGDLVDLSSVATVEEIAACPANIASLCMALVTYVKRDSCWTDPTPEMVQAGLAEQQRILDEWDAEGHIQLCHGNEPVSDDQASDAAVFIVQAMAEKLPKD